jgi:hypothetical protein
MHAQTQTPTKYISPDAVLPRKNLIYIGVDVTSGEYETTVILDDNNDVNEKNVSKLDSDGDGLSDNQELEVYGTDPQSQDSDGDGLLAILLLPFPQLYLMTGCFEVFFYPKYCY